MMLWGVKWTLQIGIWSGSNQAWPGTMAKEMHGSFVAYHMHQKRFEIYTDNFESDYFSFNSV